MDFNKIIIGKHKIIYSKGNTSAKDKTANVNNKKPTIKELILQYFTYAFLFSISVFVVKAYLSISKFVSVRVIPYIIIHNPVITMNSINILVP